MEVDYFLYFMKEVFIAFFVCALLVGGAFGGFWYYDRMKNEADLRPSIVNFTPENLPENVVVKKDSDTDEAQEEKKESVPVKPDAPETITIKVLNGGATSGSAGKMASYLKSNGYTKAESGNSNGVNSGIVIYYSPDMSDEVKVVQLLLLKEYKGVESKPVADAKVSEAKTAPIVVIMGS